VIFPDVRTIYNFLIIELLIRKLADARVHSVLHIQQVLVVINFTQSLEQASSEIGLFSILEIRKLAGNDQS